MITNERVQAAARAIDPQAWEVTYEATARQHVSLEKARAALEAAEAARHDWPRQRIVSNLLRAGVNAAEAAPWQPIETAPKDGKMDLWVVHLETGEHRRFPDVTIRSAQPGATLNWTTDIGLNVQRYWRPTHWMPLPSPPATPPAARE